MNRLLLLTLSLMTLAAQSTISDTAQTKLPEIRPESQKTTAPAAAPFFEYQNNFEALQRQIDSLKAVVTVYEKKNTLPAVDEKLLEMIPIPENQQRIILQNGTVVVGTVTGESAQEISLQTSLGRLVIRKNLVIRVDENYGIQAEVKIVGEPQIDVYPNREIVTGVVKNTGQKRADFVRVIANLWTSTTSSAGQDSAFVTGQRIKYETGIITDTSLEPGATASFRVIVPIKPGNPVTYRTQTVHWTETK